MAFRMCTKDGCVTIGARARPVHSDVKFSFEDVEGIFFNTYGRFIRGPVDKESRVWRDAPADSSIPGPFWSTRRTVTFEPPGWRPPNKVNPHAVTVVPRKDWKHKDRAGYWTPPALGAAGVTIPDDADSPVMLHEIIHSWTAYKWWRFAHQGSWNERFNQEDAATRILPQRRWTYMEGRALTESMTQHLTNEAGFPYGAYAAGVQYIREFGIARDVWAAALFGADIEPLERAICAASGSPTIAPVLTRCAVLLGPPFAINAQDRR